MEENEQPARDTLWLAITNTCRPWTRWWWMGSAVDEAEITRHLQLFYEAGIGGVEISPIYGVTGEQARFIPFLSPRWIDMLRHTVRQARRLGMDVDLLCGTGWPLGGPWVRAEDAPARVLFESYIVAEGDYVEKSIISTQEPQAVLRAIMGFSHTGQALDLSQYVDAEWRLKWMAPAGEWRVYALFQTGTGQQVKRAAPGGEGNVVDHFSAAAIAGYLAFFDQALAALPAEEQVRCLFNDSYEVYGANWTDELLPQFQRRRGYDLRHYLPALCGQDDPEVVGRVRSDYRQTIADLLLQAFVQPWTAWAHRHGALSRNQAHGSPGNLLDLYAAADIPETETFGPDWLRLAGFVPLPDTLASQAWRADVLVGKLASSAAHVAGRPLCSSESFTWLGEHGQVSLAYMKAELDVLFVMGINHVFFHGTPFSPADAEWPGWMFYATTHVAPTNCFWRDLPELNGYISRCQSFLQAGLPDNDLLLYLPIFDLWATEQGTEDFIHFLGVYSEHWLDENLRAFTAAARWSWDHGYSFDFISDQLLEQAIQVSGHQLQSRGGTYRALVVAGCTRMPLETLERILSLVRAGARVLIVADFPQDVPGLGDLAERRRRYRGALSALGPFRTLQPGIGEANVDNGRVLVGADIETMLQITGIRRERVVDIGVELIRRRDDMGYLYFLTNLGHQRVDQWTSLSIQAASIAIFDPVSTCHGMARMGLSNEHDTQIYLQLEPGESILLRTYSRPIDGPQWQYLSPAGEPVPLQGPWRVEFIAGGPTLPMPTVVEQLISWIDWPDESGALRMFSGTARYTLTFDRPSSSAERWALDLGGVCHSARVKLNGQRVGTYYARPFRLVLPPVLREGSNQLEIEVTNLMANRLAELDRQGRQWQKFFFINRMYQPFDASDWTPLPSGLLGPVRLVPLRQEPLKIKYHRNGRRPWNKRCARRLR